MRMPTSQKWFTEGSSKKLPRTNKTLIIETKKQIYIQELKEDQKEELKIKRIFHSFVRSYVY